MTSRIDGVLLGTAIVGAALLAADSVAAQQTASMVSKAPSVDVTVDVMGEVGVIWLRTTLGFAASLFAGLFACEWFIKAGKVAVRGGASLSEVFGPVWDAILERGGYLFFIASGYWVLPSILRGFQAVGSRTAGEVAATVAARMGGSGGKKTGITPQALVDGVIELADVKTAKMETLTDFLSVVGTALSAGIIVTIAYGFCAIVTWVVMIRAHLTLGGGAICLGFAGCSKTEHLARGYLNSLASTGLTLMFLELVKGLAFPFLFAWIEYARNDDGFGLLTGLRMAFGALVMAIAIWSAQGVAKGVVSGGDGGSSFEDWVKQQASSRMFGGRGGSHGSKGAEGGGVAGAGMAGAGLAAGALSAIMDFGGNPPPTGGAGGPPPGGGGNPPGGGGPPPASSSPPPSASRQPSGATESPQTGGTQDWAARLQNKGKQGPSAA